MFDASEIVNRRDFLKATALASVGMIASNQRWAQAAEGAKRWPVTVRDGMLRSTRESDCWAAMKDLAVDGVEVTIGSDMSCGGLYHPQSKYVLSSPDAVAALKQELTANGMSITAFAMGNRFDVELEKEIEWMKRLVPVCTALSVRTIRIDVVPHRLKREEFLPFAIKACKEVATIAGDGNVRLGIENHGNTTNDPDFMQNLLDGVGRTNLGLTLDTGNFYWYGHPLENVYALFEKFAPRVFHTHIKSIAYPAEKKSVRREMGWKYDEYTCPIYEGDIDFKRVAQILRKGGYDGDLCIENESLGRFPAEQRRGILKKELAMLRELEN